jgi:hypothetical protein
MLAIMTWAVCAWPVAAIPDALDLDPFRQPDADVPLVAGGFGLAILCLVLRVRRPAVAGVAAGLFASWTVLLLRTAGHGTPFAAGGALGDAGRLAAMAVRYTTTSASSDGIVAGVPSEYPPLFPWLIGKAALLMHTDAWRLVAPAEAIAVSLSIVAAFVLWSRLASPRAALAISALGLLAFGKPDKAFEVLSLAVVVPLLLLTVASPPRGRLHWLVAGVVGSVMTLTYYTYLVFALPGVLPLLWHTWRAEPNRKAYAWYLARVVAVMAALTSWYTIPYAKAMLRGGQQVADTFASSSISSSPFPFLSGTPWGAAELVGLIGVLWLWWSAWWARPLLTIVIGTYAYYLISFTRFVTTLHTGLLHYTSELISACLLAAFVLTVFHVVPRVARQARTPFPYGAAGIAIALLMGSVGYAYWQQNMPVTRWQPGPDGGALLSNRAQTISNQLAARAHEQPFPAGLRPRFSSVVEPVLPMGWFPVTPIQLAVQSVLGQDARPRVLSCSEQLFAFLPWRGYTAVDRGSAYGPTRWDDRYAELTRIAGIRDPKAFAQASAHTKFGPIDVFVLHWQKPYLVWQPAGGPAAVRFLPQQFSPGAFVLTSGLPSNIVAAIRRP